MEHQQASSPLKRLPKVLATANSSLDNCDHGVPVKSNLRRSDDKEWRSATASQQKQVQITEPGDDVNQSLSNQQSKPTPKYRQKDIKILGKLSEKAKVPKPTQFQKGLVTKSKQTKKELARKKREERAAKEGGESGSDVHFTDSLQTESS